MNPYSQMPDELFAELSRLTSIPAVVLRIRLPHPAETCPAWPLLSLEAVFFSVSLVFDP
ncbi:MAG: hypothetical protein LBD58_02615 [Treponema sp.]|nr:hypothetical protein [Treponema sp.]